MKYIDKLAFSGCSSLTSVTIPESVTNIGKSAFENCRKLSSVRILNPDCKIYDDASTFTTAKDIFIGVFRGYEGSTVQEYAKNYERRFAVLEEEKFALGDLNGDEHIDVTDITILSTHLLCDKKMKRAGLKAADVDSDGEVALTDLARLRQYVSKIITEF